MACVVSTLASNFDILFISVATDLAAPAAARPSLNKSHSYDQAVLEEPWGLSELKEEEEEEEEGEGEREEEEGEEEEGEEGQEGQWEEEGEGEEGGGVEGEWEEEEYEYEHDSKPFLVSFCFIHSLSFQCTAGGGGGGGGGGGLATRGCFPICLPVSLAL